MNDLTKGNEAKKIFLFALPMILGNLLQQLYNFVDKIIVGNYMGDNALAAVGASLPIFFLLISFVIGIGSGATIVISQYYGAKDLVRVKKAITTIYIFLFFVSFLLMFIGIYFANDIFVLLKVDEKVLPLAVTYFRVYMSGTIAFFGFNGTASILRGLGDSKTPLFLLIMSSVFNIILDLLFVIVFNLEIIGVALATVVSQVLAFIGAIIYLEHKQKLISFNFKKWVFDKKLFEQSLRIGLPTGFQQSFVAFAMIALLRIVNKFDVTVLTAYTIANQIDSVAVLPAVNLASALSAFVGQNIGAGRYDRIRRGLISTLILGFTFSFLFMLLAYVKGEFLIGMFSESNEVIQIGNQYLIIVSSFYVVFSMMFAFHGLLRGAGATLIPMFITLFSIWIIRIPLAIVLPEYFGVEGIWYSIPSGWICGLMGTLIYYLSGKWKKKSVFYI